MLVKAIWVNGYNSLCLKYLPEQPILGDESHPFKRSKMAVLLK